MSAPPSPTHRPPPLPPVTSVATQLLLCCSQSKHCSKTNHAVKIAALPQQRDDVNTRLWSDRRTPPSQSGLRVPCVYSNPGLLSRSLGAPAAITGLDTCARLQHAGSLGVTCSVCFTGYMDWWLLGTHWSSWERTGHHGNALVIINKFSPHWGSAGDTGNNLIIILLNQDAYIGKKIVFKVQLPLGPDSNSLGSDSAVTM